VYVGPERVEIQQVPEPALRAGEVRLRVQAAGICGSDIHGFLGHSARRQRGLVMGHETVALVEDVHPTVDGWRPSQRVCFNPLVSCGACHVCGGGRENLCPDWRLFGMDRLQGTYAERVAVPARQLHALPDGLPDLEAILVEPMAVLVHAFRLAAITDPAASLAIIGAGPIGALALVLAKLRGLERVCVVDVNEQRLSTARRLGADLVVPSRAVDPVPAVRAWTSGGGAEIVVEAVGHDGTRRAAADMAARGARLVFLGMAENETALPWVDMLRNEQSVVTSFAYTPADFAASVALISSRRVDLTPWTEAWPLERGQDAFLKMAHDPGPTLKMMLTL
jgi:threonine dehydrogenase-like Zn-dependent dehydrogenase